VPVELVDQHPSNAFPINAVLLSARRSRGAVSVRLRLVNDGTAPPSTGALFYEQAYLYDYINQRKYPVLKDENGSYLADPKSDLNKGGRWWTSSLGPGKKQLMALKFQSPPDSIDEVSLVIPLLVPFERVKLTGKSGVTKVSGLQVHGAESSVKRILKDLQAEESDKEIMIRLSAEVLFDHDQHEIRPDAESALNDVLTVIREYSDSRIRIDGHTDSTGSEDYNLNLSEQRAEAVKDWLAEHGIESSRMTTCGLGESQPVASNEDVQGRQLNRRVEIVIEK